MKKLFGCVALMWLGACSASRGAVKVDPQTASGASSPKAAVESFLTAARNDDLQGMSATWGTEKGAARDLMNREQLEQRLIVMHCSLKHDKFSYVDSRPALQAGGRQNFQIELKQQALTAKTVVTVIMGPSERWYVENVNLQPLNQFCR